MGNLGLGRILNLGQFFGLKKNESTALFKKVSVIRNRGQKLCEANRTGAKYEKATLYFKKGLALIEAHLEKDEKNGGETNVYSQPIFQYQMILHLDLANVAQQRDDLHESNAHISHALTVSTRLDMDSTHHVNQKMLAFAYLNLCMNLNKLREWRRCLLNGREVAKLEEQLAGYSLEQNVEGMYVLYFLAMANFELGFASFQSGLVQDAVGFYRKADKVFAESQPLRLSYTFGFQKVKRGLFLALSAAGEAE